MLNCLGVMASLEVVIEDEDACGLYTFISIDSHLFEAMIVVETNLLALHRTLNCISWPRAHRPLYFA